MSSDAGGTFVGLWVAAGVLGAIIALSRGRLNFGLATWLFFGWWGLFLIAFFGGGLLLAWSLIPSGNTRCPSCREQVRKDASICPHCRSVLTPAMVEPADPVVDEPSAPPDPDLVNPAFLSGGTRPK